VPLGRWGGARCSCWRGRGRTSTSARGRRAGPSPSSSPYALRRPRRSWSRLPPIHPAIYRRPWRAARWSSRPGRPLSRCCRVPRRVMIDLSAVTPAGIEGVAVADKGVEHNGVLAYGAIGVGDLKMKIHKAAIARLFERNDLVLDAEEVYALGEGL